MSYSATDSMGTSEAPWSLKASSPNPSQPLLSEPSQQIPSISQLQLSIRDAIPNPPLPKSNCDNPVATSNVLHEEDLESNEPIQLINKFDYLISENQYEPCEKDDTHEKAHNFTESGLPLHPNKLS